MKGMTLSESFMYNYQLQAQLNPISLVYQAIEAALAPWSPGRVDIYRQDMPFYGEMELMISVELLPHLRFKTNPRVLVEPTQMMFEVAGKAFEFYRNRPILPIDDHIVLGEE